MASVKHRLPTEKEIDRSRKLGRQLQQASYAKSVRYSPSHDAFVLHMYSGAVVEIPRKFVPYVRDADRRHAAAVTLSPAGSGLHWESLDMDHSVPGLIRDLFGITEQHRRAGATKSPARAAASRANGKLGGRKRKRHKRAA